MEAGTKARAWLIWEAMSANERKLVRFGCFPADKMKAAEALGFDGHALAVALMDCARSNGGTTRSRGLVMSEKEYQRMLNRRAWRVVGWLIREFIRDLKAVIK
jgi:hypothetical protein